MDSGIDPDVLNGLKELYLRQLKERLSTLEQAVIDLTLGQVDADDYGALEFEVHRLNGTGATYGFPAISRTAEILEEHLRSPLCDPHTVIMLLNALITEIAKTLSEESSGHSGEIPLTISSPSEQPAHRPSVLVADDDPAMLNLVMQLLSPWTNVQCVESGRAAIEAVERRRFDLVILDCEFPDMTGLDVLNRIGGTEFSARSPVMMLTAVREPERVARLIAAGAQHYLVKPIAPAQLIERVSFLLSTQKKVVMVADDDPLIREIFRKRFTQRGHEVVLATNGAQALTMIRRIHPQVIVLDRQMPRLDGIEVLQELRRGKDTRSIPVIMLSARSSSNDMYSGYREGANAYIPKPFVPDQVIDCCESFLQPRDMGARTSAARNAWENHAFV